MTESSSALEYYARQSIITDPKGEASLFERLPTDIPSLCKVVQGLLIHIFWAERYGEQLSDERRQQVQLRHVARTLARIRELDNRPLTLARPLDKKLVGNCRDFTTLLCAMLRHQGVPARARCGFGVYFEPDHYEDHWVVEYWNVEAQRWVSVDAQLDEFQRKALGTAFDPCDVPRDQFLPGGRAWQLCRAGQADPDHFGILDMHGLWFVQSDFVRDVASLNKVELLPWDCWGLGDVGPDGVASAEDAVLLDRVAPLTLAGNEAFAELRSIYESDARLRVPPVIRSYTQAGAQEIKLSGV